MATSSMPTALPSRLSTALFVVACGQYCGGNNIDRGKVMASPITYDGEMPSSPIMDCSRWSKPNDWRVNPDEETTNWRARRGKTAHRVRREGMARVVPYPYPTRRSTPLPSVAGRCAIKPRIAGEFKRWRLSNETAIEQSAGHFLQRGTLCGAHP